MRVAVLLVVALVTAPFAASVAQAQAAKEGQTLFHQRCAMCHTAKSGAPAGIGPNLAGVNGRKAGSTNFAYTAAMKNHGVTWNSRELDKLLTNPSRTVPGSTMTFAVPNPKERAAIIAYLVSLKR